MLLAFLAARTWANRLAGEALLEHVIGTAEPEYTTPYDINLIGEYNIAGETWGVLPLFEKAGHSGACQNFRRCPLWGNCLRPSGQAECADLLQGADQPGHQNGGALRHSLQPKNPSTASKTSTIACAHIAQRLGDADLQARVEALIAEETARLDVQLAPYRERLKDKRVVIYTGGVKSWSINLSGSGSRHQSSCHQHPQEHRSRQSPHQRPARSRRHHDG